MCEPVSVETADIRVVASVLASMPDVEWIIERPTFYADEGRL
jgi:hypothetical protein